jgi:hypothetical protein
MRRQLRIIWQSFGPLSQPQMRRQPFSHSSSPQRIWLARSALQSEAFSGRAVQVILWQTKHVVHSPLEEQSFSNDHDDFSNSLGQNSPCCSQSHHSRHRRICDRKGSCPRPSNCRSSSLPCPSRTSLAGTWVMVQSLSSVSVTRHTEVNISF